MVLLLGARRRRFPHRSRNRTSLLHPGRLGVPQWCRSLHPRWMWPWYRNRSHRRLLQLIRRQIHRLRRQLQRLHQLQPKLQRRRLSRWSRMVCCKLMAAAKMTEKSLILTTFVTGACSIVGSAE